MKVQSWVAALAAFTVVMWLGVLGKGILIRQTVEPVRLAHATARSASGPSHALRAPVAPPARAGSDRKL